MDDIDKLLEAMAEAKPCTNRKCSVCGNEKLAATIARWLERRNELPSFSTMYVRVFRGLGDVGKSTIRDHITLCLGLDHTTGKPYGA